MGLGSTEIVLILFVVLLLFGGKKIPELAKGLGSGIKNFKKAINIWDTTGYPKISPLRLLNRTHTTETSPN
jgi:sec-independent protein translocase protein TatA